MSTVDRFFSQLEDLLGSLLGEGSGRRSQPSRDPDFAEAMDELDDFLRTGETTRREWQSTGGSDTRQPKPANDLGQEYRDLEVPLGAPLADVRKSYRRLMQKYHPDHFAGDAKQQRTATEISAKLNASFQRIKQAEEAT